MIEKPPTFAVFRQGVLMEVTRDPTIYMRVSADTMSDVVRKEQFLVLPVDNMDQAIRLLTKMVEKGNSLDPLVISSRQLLEAMKVNAKQIGR